MNFVILKINQERCINNYPGKSIDKIDIGKSFDKLISIDKLNLNDIDFIGQSIKFDTHTPTKF